MWIHSLSFQRLWHTWTRGAIVCVLRETNKFNNWHRHIPWNEFIYKRNPEWLSKSLGLGENDLFSCSWNAWSYMHEDFITYRTTSYISCNTQQPLSSVPNHNTHKIVLRSYVPVCGQLLAFWKSVKPRKSLKIQIADGCFLFYCVSHLYVKPLL